MTNLFDLTGKTAVVTGASSGLGIMMAKALAGNGAAVALVARKKEKLDAVQQELTGAGADCRGMEAVKTKEPPPYGPAYMTRMRLRMARLSIITTSGDTVWKASAGGHSTGRLPYSSFVNSARSSGARTFSHCSTVDTFSPANVVIRSGTSFGSAATDCRVAAQATMATTKPFFAFIFRLAQRRKAAAAFSVDYCFAVSNGPRGSDASL